MLNERRVESLNKEIVSLLGRCGADNEPPRTPTPPSPPSPACSLRVEPARERPDLFIPCYAANVYDLRGNYAHLNVPINDIIHAQVLR